jgi:hypothetical protein
MPGQPTYLFESSFLLSLSLSLYQELQPQDLCELPTVKCSEYFPYQSEGKACFVCEQDEPDGHINNETVTQQGKGKSEPWLMKYFAQNSTAQN